MLESRNFIAIPPGASIKEQLENRGMSQKEFACRMDLSEKHVSKLINGEVKLTHEMAAKLELVLGVPAHFWNNLESIYREKLIKAQAENEMDEDIQIIKKIPYSEMSKHGWVPSSRRSEDKVINLRKFFEIVCLKLLDNTQLFPGIAYRKLSDTKKADYALLAWAQKAKIDARTIDTKPINIQLLIDSIPKIRAMTIMNPEDFCPALVEMMANCGIAIVFLPHIGGSFLHGSTFYDGTKVVMGLTVRGKDADRFWFSLFHEIGHIILGHLGKTTETSETEEKSADEFARQSLIPDNLFNEFISHGDFSRDSMIAEAKEMGIDVGILIGRLQKEHYIDFSWHNDLKTKYTIS